MRNEFKKIFCVLLAILMISTLSFGLMGCNKADDGTATTEATATGTVDATGETVEDATGETTEPTGDATEPTGDATEATGETTDATTDTTAATEAGSNGHVHNYVENIIPPDCVKDGYNLYECECGASYKAGFYKALGHDYTVTKVPASNGQPGYTKYHCPYCHDEYTETDTTTQGGGNYEPPSNSALAAKIAEYINYYRAQAGASPATLVNGLTTIAQERSAQLVYDYRHDGIALNKLCEKYQYGRYVDMTEFGGSASDNYYSFGGAEAICKGEIYGDADYMGKRIAESFYNSSGHWRYVGDGANAYVGVGVSYDLENMTVYICVNLSKENYG